MRKDIEYITIDGRGEHDGFKDCVTETLKKLKSGEGIHIIKEFEPFPLYKLMEKKGLEKYIEKVSDTEYHGYFFPAKQKVEDIEMYKYLKLDSNRIQTMLDIKLDYLFDRISAEEAKKRMNSAFDKVTAEEFAIAEQHLMEHGITDDILAERMDDILAIFEGLIESDKSLQEKGHPIRTYQDEAIAIEKLLLNMESQLTNKFIKNEWLEHYDKLVQINIHFSRKQNQLFTALEKKGFDRPSKVMWTLDNTIRDEIKSSKELLNQNLEKEFLEKQENVIYLVRDMMLKESDILYPTSLELLSDEEFEEMRIGDDEIGYCLIDNPPKFPNSKKESDIISGISNDSELVDELATLLNKYQKTTKNSPNDILQVSQGELTLEQINLIYKHLQVDLSYVDENEIVKFYSDTVHRVFPRSKGVIGRHVKNCHPRESVEQVEEIIRAFRTGEQDKAEFWLEINNKFIYIIYNAVRDSEGKFRGVLEMMQDVTHIRALTGSQRLVSWKNESINEENTEIQTKDNKFNINGSTVLGPLVKEYPFIKDFLLSLSPKYEKLKNPILFKTMSSIATIDMISKRGNLEVQFVIDKIVDKINESKK